MGINNSLKLRGNQFSNAASSFWIAVAVAAAFSTFPLQKIPTGKWMGACLILWGISTAAHSAVKNYVQLVAVRVLSGIFEASLPPAIMLLSAQYYTRQEQSMRYSLWYTGLGFGQIAGALISFGFQHVSPKAPLNGWRTMFLVLGLFTVAMGALICVFVPDTPMQAKFFTDEEKVVLLEHIKVNQTGITNRKWDVKQILEALLDPQYWLMCGAILLQGTGGGFISTYSATLLRNFGFSPKKAALLGMPSGVMNIISMLFVGYGARFFGRRLFWSLSAMCIGLVGACLVAFSNPHHKPAMLAGLYLANFFTGCTPLNFQWFTGNTAGHTKRALVAASTNAAFAIGNIIGPLTFKAQDAPAYKPAKVTLVGCWAGSAGCLILVTLYYVWANKRRDAASVESDFVDTEVDKTIAYAGMTDKENPYFRYSI
ncbi:putative MFS transporter [Myriangium duriaei CBS 260.36]|uniref:MFS transporter n=1 Tax=Myriangium duriaei CBS 260.36 TaxID=1168546 RepID=A0A9P4J9I5_9PEZI|nr:putative MFS transporter [Myriangium duriaei CBS 260.36]